MSKVEVDADDLMIVRALDKGKFVRVNDSFSAKTGFDATELAEKPFLDWIAPCDRTIVQAALENGEKSFFARHITRDGGTLQLGIQVAEHEDGLFLLGRCANVSTQHEADKLRPAEATVSGTLDAIARIIEEQNPGYKCSILLVAEGRFVFGAGPSLPSEYNSAVNGYAVGPTVGSCGTAIFWNTPVIVADIQADPLWVPLAALAKKAGVAACWSHPFVSSSGKVLGALALYSPEPRAPTTEQLGRLKAAARITGLAVERGRAEEELKRANEATKAARNQLQAILNAMPDLLFEVDAEGRFVSYHVHRHELLAVPPEAFMGKRFADVLPSDAADAIQRAIDEAAQNGSSYGETFRLALPQGENWFELSVAPSHADAKSDQRFIIISRDITERKRLEIALSRERAMLGTLVNTLPDLIWLKDAEGVFLSCNKRFEQYFGVPVASIIGKTDYDFLSQELADYFREHDKKAMEHNGPTMNEEEITFASDGHHEILETTKTPMRDEAGKLIGVLGIGHDITARKQNERDLQQREQYQRALLDNFPFAVWLKDSESRFLAVNQGLVQLVGQRNAGELIGKNDFDIWPAELAEGYRADDRAVLASGEKKNVEEEIVDADGTRKWFETYKAPIFDAAGGVVGSVGFARDITERKREERRLALAFGAAKIVVWEIDFITGKLFYDGSAMTGLGLDKANAPESLEDWLARVHTDDRAQFTKNVEQVLQPGNTLGFDSEYRFDDNAGGYHWLQSVGRVLQRDSAGRPLLAAGYSVNIDERKKAEEELRKLSLAMEQSPESIVITNLDAEIEYVNAAFVQNTGYRREEVIGQNPRILHSGKTPQATFDSLWQTITAGETWKGEFHNRRRDASEYIEFAIITPLRQDDGKITHYVAVKEDITEKKRLGEELNQYRHHLEDQVAQRTSELMLAKIQAEAANRAKSAFLANMSHELRTPMNGVLGMIGLAKRRMSDAKGLDQLEKAELSSNRLLGVLNDILDISKIEADRMVFESVPLQISAVVENLTHTLGHKAAEKGLRLSIDLPANLIRQPLKGDPLRLGQILFNLVGNAIKFTSQGAVSLRVSAVGESSEAMQIRFEVSDTGIGIEPEAQTPLFQSFEQADNSMTRKYGGTGLGLAITKRLVQLMGGEIGIESTVGQGSNFWFIVPIKKSEQSATQVVPSVAELAAGHRLKAEYAGTRVLLAEDEPITQEISRDLLEDLGFVVDLADDGLQAVELAKQNAYALILMDMQMPHMNGVDATKEIRTLPAYAQTPILAMTANAFDDDRQVCLDAGMNDHIAKPVDSDVLCEILLCWLRKSTVAVPV
jgi:PAS domain S-box-containing protein